jgi:hypothetical protein
VTQDSNRIPIVGIQVTQDSNRIPIVGIQVTKDSDTGQASVYCIYSKSATTVIKLSEC